MILGIMSTMIGIGVKGNEILEVFVGYNCGFAVSRGWCYDCKSP